MPLRICSSETIDTSSRRESPSPVNRHSRPSPRMIASRRRAKCLLRVRLRSASVIAIEAAGRPGSTPTSDWTRMGVALPWASMSRS